MPNMIVKYGYVICN